MHWALNGEREEKKKKKGGRKKIKIKGNCKKTLEVNSGCH